MFGRKRKFKNVDVEITESEKEKLPKGFGYDPYPEWCREIEEKNERRKKEISDRFDCFVRELEEAKSSLSEYNPEVEVRGYAAGYFLCFDDHELPLRHIEGIEILSHGGDPRIEEMYTRGLDCSFYADYKKRIKDYPRRDRRKMPEEYHGFAIPNYALISVRLASGRVEKIYCLRPQLEILKDRLEQAWKHGE